MNILELGIYITATFPMTAYIRGVLEKKKKEEAVVKEGISEEKIK